MHVPVALDDFTYLFTQGETTGMDECISNFIEAVTNEIGQKQLQEQHESQNHLISTQQCPIKPIHNTSSSYLSPSSPRRSSAHAQLHLSKSVAKNDMLAAADDARAYCIFCEASQSDREYKQRRERSRITTINPVTGHELSPGGAPPLRDPVATCAMCNGNVCEAHLMLHSVKMPAHWESLTFYDGIVDSAYRSLPPQARLLSRVLFRCRTAHH